MSVGRSDTLSDFMGVFLSTMKNLGKNILIYYMELNINELKLQKHPSSN